MATRRRTDGRTFMDDFSAIQEMAHEAGMYV